MTVNPYLNFPGTTEEAFNFYKNIFGGEFTTVMRFSDTPEGEKVPPAVREKIMHISLPIGGNNLMATDAIEEMGFRLKSGNNVYICLNPDSRDETDRIFNALSEGGTVNMPLQDMFWGDYYGDLTDKYGIKWMLVHSNQKN